MNLQYKRALPSDAAEILSLQYLAYQSEAQIYQDDQIEPLVQTLDDLKEQMNHQLVLIAVQDQRILGSVRACTEGGTCYIGKLIVHPDSQGQGIGQRLMAEIEQLCSAERYELFTGSKSLRNIRLYQKLGYRIFHEKKINEQLSLVFMEK